MTGGMKVKHDGCGADIGALAGDAQAELCAATTEGHRLPGYRRTTLSEKYSPKVPAVI